SLERLFEDPEATQRIIRRALAPSSARPDEQRQMRKAAKAHGDRRAEQKIDASIMLDQHTARGNGIIASLAHLAQAPEKTGIASMSEAVAFAQEEGVISERGHLARAAKEVAEVKSEDLGRVGKGPDQEMVRSLRLKAALQAADGISDPIKRAERFNQIASIAQAAGEPNISEATSRAAIALAQARIEEHHRSEKKREKDQGLEIEG
ncbi:hypothetical protein, partial [Tranquillimonas alkanivorans]